MANKHKGNGFSKAAQGSSTEGQKKAEQRKVQEAIAKEKAKKERLSHQNAVKANKEKNLLSAYHQSCTLHGKLADGLEDRYGIKDTDGNIAIIDVSIMDDKTIITVVESEIQGLPLRDDAYLLHYLLKSPAIKKILSEDTYQWQLKLHTLLREIVLPFYAAKTPAPKKAEYASKSHAPQFGQAAPEVKPATNVVELRPAIKTTILPLGKILAGTEGLYNFSDDHSLYLELKKRENGMCLVVKKISCKHPLSLNGTLIVGSVIYTNTMEEKEPKLYALMQNLLVKAGVKVKNIRAKTAIKSSSQLSA